MRTVFLQLNYLLDKKTKRNLIIVFIMILVGSAAELLGVTMILPIVDLAMTTEKLSNNIICKMILYVTKANTKEEVLLYLIGLTVLLYIAKNIYIIYMYKKQYTFAANVRINLSTRLMEAYLNQPYSFFLNENSSNLMRSVTTDVDQLYQLIMNVLNIISNGLTGIVIVLFLSVSNIIMTATIVIVLGGCLIAIVGGLQKTNRRNGRENQYLSGMLTKYLRQAFEGAKEIKLMNTEKHFINMYKTTYKKSSDISIKMSLYAVEPKYLIETFAIVAILGYLGANIIFNENYIDLIPQLAVFCVAAFKLLPCVNATYASANSVIFYRASLDTVYRDIKDSDELLGDTLNDDDDELFFEHKIELKNIYFNYDNSDKLILNNASMEIPKGKSVALIGPSGGGKTTTADIILTLLKATKGNVLIDGKEFYHKRKKWRRKIGYIPQNIYLIDDTIRANIAFGIDETKVDDKKIWKALEDAQLKEFVKSLPDGLDSIVGERGSRISGGQRQRIGIARALYHNPEVLVFDEATSALDNETEKEVMRAIDGLKGRKTMIMIAHRLSTIENCDIVYYVENGEIIRKNK